MRGTSAKILLGFLVVALIAPTLFVARPQKAEALVSLAACISAKSLKASIAGAAAAAQAVVGVTIGDPVGTVVQAEGPAGTDWVQCFLNSMAVVIGKTLLHTFTQSIVNWINTGFQGSPSFITNPEGFLNDVADQTIGRIIEDISPLLCAPFRLDVRFALGLNISLNTRDEIHCRLSDVLANVRGAYDGFVQGAVGSGNLSRWIHIAGTQQNNPYGAYIATTNKLSVGITSATGQQIKLLDWGQGFKSWRSCVERAPDVIVRGNTPGGGYGVIGSRKGACIKEGPIKTPGSVIVAQANESLGGTLRELEVADEIDAVVFALINQLLKQVMNAGGGLLGASKGSSGSGGRSAVDALLTDPERALAISEAETPDGINCRLRYYPATTETPTGSKIYVPDETRNTVYTDNLGFGRTVGVAEGDNRAFVAAMFIRRGETTPTAVEKGRETWREYFNRVREGCSNQFNTLIADASARGRDRISESAGDISSLPTPPLPPTTRMPTSRAITIPFHAVNQSHIAYLKIEGFDLRAGPERALYGSSVSSTAGGQPPHWWTASLKPTTGSTERIKIINIRTYKSETPIQSVSLANIPPENGKAGIPITLDDFRDAVGGDYIVYSYPSAEDNAVITGSGSSGDLTITFIEPVEANAIQIVNYALPSRPQQPLILELVRLYGPAETVEGTQ